MVGRTYAELKLLEIAMTRLLGINQNQQLSTSSGFEEIGLHD